MFLWPNSDPRLHQRLSQCRDSDALAEQDYDSPFPFNSIDRLGPDQGKDGRWDIVQRRSCGRVADCTVSSCRKEDVEGVFVDSVVASDAEVVFVSLSALWLQKAPVLPKEGLVVDVYRSLKFCVKGMEHGAPKGTMADTK